MIETNKTTIPVMTTEPPPSTADIARRLDDRAAAQAHPAEERTSAPLLPEDTTASLRESWTDVQASFVDEPRRAVREADQLVASAIKNIADVFARERQNLESQWDRDGDVSTEDLRIALTRYRSFFHRLLSM